MSNASVWFVAIDETGNIGRPKTDPPASPSQSLPRVTTIHVVNWHSQSHHVTLSFDPGPSEDIMVDVPAI
jgi:hypothetical protein